MKIAPFTEKYIDSTLNCSNKYIGADYYTNENLFEVIKRSQKGDLNSSFVLLDENNEVQGFRLSYPPGQWLDLKSPNKVAPELWRVPAGQVAYFQTIFLADSARGGGWGAKLSEKSIEVLKAMGAKAIVCHSWKESPHNSSMKYLEKLGFEKLKEYPNYWMEIDYDCIRCGKPCLCTASEMVFYL